MTKRTVSEAALLILLLLLFSISCAAYHALPTKNVENTFETGIIDISLSTWQLNEKGEEVEWEDVDYVTPNSTISNIKRITNESDAPCYLRAKVSFLDTELVTTDHLIGISEDWILKEDGYYYYMPVVEGKESVDLFTALHIPEYVPDEQEGRTFSMHVVVDALQSKNVTPDFEADMPWGEVVVLKADTDGKNILKTVENYTALFITYLGETDSLIADPEDFFVNLPVFYPGDEYSDTLVLNNESEDQIRLYFRSDTADEGDDTLSRMQMKISVERADGTVEELYSGPIETDEFAEDTAILSLLSGQSGKLHFTVTMPTDMDNAYTLKHKSVLWTFSTEVIPEEIPATPDTGDHFCTAFFIAVMTFSAGAFMSVIIVKVKRKW